MNSKAAKQRKEPQPGRDALSFQTKKTICVNLASQNRETNLCQLSRAGGGEKKKRPFERLLCLHCSFMLRIRIDSSWSILINSDFLTMTIVGSS